MQLKTFIEEILMDQLSHSNLANVILKEINTLNPPLPTELLPASFPLLLGKLVTAINLGLTRIYAELPLAQEEVFLQTNSAMDTYLLDIKHAEYAGRDYLEDKWIIDTELSPFRNNIIKCLFVSDEFGARWSTNDSVATLNVNFPSANTIQVPFADIDVSLSIIYQAGHPRIPYSASKTILQADGSSLGYTLPEMELELPSHLLNALSCFVASKYFKAIGSQEAMAQSQLLHAEYFSDIKQAKDAQLIHGDYTEIDHLTNQGWV